MQSDAIDSPIDQCCRLNRQQIVGLTVIRDVDLRAIVTSEVSDHDSQSFAWQFIQPCFDGRIDVASSSIGKKKGIRHAIEYCR